MKTRKKWATVPEPEPMPWDYGKLNGLSKEGADTLARIIRNKWRKCGYEVDINIITAPGQRDGALYMVRADLVAGLPRSVYESIVRRKANDTRRADRAA